MSQLSAGVCARLNDASPEEIDELGSGYTVQLLSIKKVNQTTSTAPAIDRYRIILSDGVHFVQAMLATQLNELVSRGDIVKNSIVVIDKLTCNFVQDKRLIIILDFHVASRDEEKIGNPVAAPSSSAVPPNTATETPDASTSMTPQSTICRPTAACSAASTRLGRSIYPIEGLSPYQNNWTIKARVTNKSDIRTWSNQRGEGKLFNVTLMDETGEIRATAFNAVVDELYDKFEENKVYYISKGRINLAKKKFSNVQNDYEMNLEKNTEIEECVDASNLPMIKYNFVSLSSLETLQKDATCDVIGIVKEVGPLGEVVSKATNKSASATSWIILVAKRDLTLVDKSLYSVRMTIWGRQAETFSADDLPVVAFKSVKVGDFGGRSLSMLSSSYMTISPDIEEAHLLRGWYDGIGAEKSFQSHSGTISSGGSSFGAFNRNEIRHLSDVKESQLGMSDKADFFSVRATVMHIKSENIAYPACPTQGCSKKVTDLGDGWRCEKCDKSFERPEYRYIMSMAVADWSGQAWLQGFNDAGLAVFGKTADELMEIKEHEFNALMVQSAGKTFNFNCRAKQDTYNEQTRVRYGISKISQLDYYEEAKYLRDLIKESSWAQ
ncbi:hypothetical protein HD554DRAFT_2289372 [Boletus coccyginus]|nr:hypothetical protein HD554DRAFT_2289372 [Boletus coccyginus]